MNKEEQEVIWFAGALAVMGAIIGLGKLLQSREPITFRLAVGRAIVTAGLAVGAFTLLAFIPDAPKQLIAGVAVIMASLGESGIETLIRVKLGKK